MKRVLKVQEWPSTWGGGDKEWNWCKAIAKKVKETGGSEIVDKKTVFCVKCFFRVSENKNGNDVDNLAKPVLDTLFCARQRARRNGRELPTGVLFNVNDNHVVELYVRKEIVRNKEDMGAKIEIWW